MSKSYPLLASHIIQPKFKLPSYLRLLSWPTKLYPELHSYLSQICLPCFISARSFQKS